MMLKGIFSISLAALLLAIVAFGALEVWMEIQTRQGNTEITQLDDPRRPFVLPHGVEASPTH